ncbi:uncharacterized protein At4g00950 [Rhododendron vialii]|uniref:uncharacterized protein At4g00950 n=1 Tax=Rhododendron vialii TaxID=182163 RepID=UPI00265E7377|nr:uncharacterized protein At4g00950 [Rhododendron vialii]
MGSTSKEAEEEAEPIISAPKLPLLSIQLPVSHDSPEHSGMLTPPLHTSASVPFRWEEEPGKPRPCTALITTTTQTLSHQDPHSTDTPNYNNKCLELPPRLQSFIDPKMSSPTTVLDGPYSFPLFQSSSFRFTTTRRRERQGSFGSSCGGSPERGQFGNSINNVLLSNKSSSSVTVDHEGNKGRSSGGFFGSWRRKSSHKRGKSEVGGGGSFVFSSSVELAGFGTFDDLESGGGAKVKKVSRIARNSSFSSLSQVRSHFWATIYKGFKQVLPWKSTNARKDGLLV